MPRPQDCVLLGLVLLGIPSCKQPFRVGEYVLVDWEENRPFAAYITERTGTARYRVHFDGYECDQEVSLERIKGRVQGSPPPPSPGKLPCARAVSAAPSGSGPAITPAPFKPNDHVRVTWRGTIYSATVLQVITKDRFLVHYEGLESAWDEVVGLDRIVGRRP